MNNLRWCIAIGLTLVAVLARPVQPRAHASEPATPTATLHTDPWPHVTPTNTDPTPTLHTDPWPRVTPTSEPLLNVITRYYVPLVYLSGAPMTPIPVVTQTPTNTPIPTNTATRTPTNTPATTSTSLPTAQPVPVVRLDDTRLAVGATAAITISVDTPYPLELIYSGFDMATVRVVGVPAGCSASPSLVWCMLPVGHSDVVVLLEGVAVGCAEPSVWVRNSDGDQWWWPSAVVVE